MSGNNSTVQLLVETLGANKGAKDNSKQTPLHLAALKGHGSTI
jgi:ankyrin repeat protein